MADQFDHAHFEHKPQGYIIIDGIEKGHTLQCPHCGIHFLSMRGSGKIRGRCLKCMGTTCGNKDCDVCIPYERKMEIEELRWRKTQMKREVEIEKQIKFIERIYKITPYLIGGK